MKNQTSIFYFVCLFSLLTNLLMGCRSSDISSVSKQPEKQPSVEDSLLWWTHEYGEWEWGEFCEGGKHSEVVLVEGWMRKLKYHDVYISGAFDGACIDDLETALEFLELPFTRIEELII